MPLTDVLAEIPFPTRASSFAEVGERSVGVAGVVLVIANDGKGLGFASATPRWFVAVVVIRRGSVLVGIVTEGGDPAVALSHERRGRFVTVIGALRDIT